MVRGAPDARESIGGPVPLAARMRPRVLDEFFGQEHIVGPGRLLRRAIEADRVGSTLFYGPPGTGKTTLARVIASSTRSEFESLNAVLAGVQQIREVIARAAERRAPSLLGRPKPTILFVDEVHRFNKAQQDALLPHVENGTVTLIGATTENPYFEVNKALVSRSRVFELKALDESALRQILLHALGDEERGYGGRAIEISDDATAHLVRLAGGDGRNVLNALELAVETTTVDPDGVVRIDLEVAQDSIQRRALLYDKDGDVHYDTISAFIKSLRGSDPDAALFWMARMIRAGEDPLFVARRMLIFASEDVGMADPSSLNVANAAFQAVRAIGLPECQFALAQACIHLSTAPKSNSTMAFFEALRAVDAGEPDEVPTHLKDSSRDGAALGHGKAYRYPHAFREHWVAQQYLPDGLSGAVFYEPSDQGFERRVKEHVDRLRALARSGSSASTPGAVRPSRRSPSEKALDEQAPDEKTSPDPGRASESVADGGASPPETTAPREGDDRTRR